MPTKADDLYYVHTIVKEYAGCKHIKFSWFRTEKSDRPYGQLVKDYNPDEAMAAYSELAVDELFSFDEANALKRYLDWHHGAEDETTIVKAEIPLANNVGGMGALAVGGGDDFYELHKEPEYSLPFKVEGYFNLVGCELIDEPGETFRHFLFLATVDKDGRVADFRKETQAEARLREAEAERRERDQAA
jgi:hypothetical protein